MTLTFELGRNFCTVYLTAKFHRPTFSRSEVIVRTNTLTNKHTPLETSASLRYATPVGKKQLLTAFQLLPIAGSWSRSRRLGLETVSRRINVSSRSRLGLGH